VGGEDATEVQSMVPIAGLSDEEFAALAASILVVIPHRSNEGIAAGICTHFGMWGRIGLRVATVKDPHGGFIECTRGGIVQLFLEAAWKTPELRYLVMIDNDQSILWDAPLRLAQWGKPVVSAVVCGYNPERGIFACFTAKDENGIARFPSYRDTKFLPAEGLIDVEQTGTGLVCIRRDVLEVLRENDEEPFMIPEDTRRKSVRQGQLAKSEDICFSERCAKYGFNRYVDLSVHATHHKTIPIGWPMECINESISAVDWKPSAFDYKGVL
jgi:hypothetical protein